MRMTRVLPAVLALAVVSVTGCANAGDDGTVKVGYVVNFGSHEWYQNVIKGADDGAKQQGFDFEWADANVDLPKQITQCENMLTQGVDVLMLSPVDPDGLSSVMSQAEEADVPVVTESNTVPGAKTAVGIHNLEAAKLLGQWAGDHITNTMRTKAKVLIVGLPTQVDTRDRVEGFKQGLEASGADYEIVQEVNGGGLKDQALDVSADAITAHPDVNMIFGINDDSALGGTQAYQEAGLDISKLTTLGFGVEGRAGKSALSSGGPYKAGLGMFPEFVGRTLIEQAKAVNEGKDVPERTVTPATVLTADNLSDYYTKDGDDWKIDYDAVEALLEQQK
ncbi:MAG: substrate-binding domain-containing protein [Actinophytocola sp.]|uniref:sugar ABC transporter substrate-binding protein n=1 Tax=Actinophytocola sp. TaxID=1872138 RepID=UPI00132C74D1|nr:sugar ABC transporter substrate-binding protein [Actinophytocola sp.]MPZ82699.1 substrate-binding domain-containing protein [Actinophytocola sp.]